MDSPTENQIITERKKLFFTAKTTKYRSFPTHTFGKIITCLTHTIKYGFILSGVLNIDPH